MATPGEKNILVALKEPSPPMHKQILPPDTARKALAMADWLRGKKAEDIRLLNMSDASPMAEVMVIATAQGARHAQALADWLLKNMAEAKMTCLGMEGYREGNWILLDCNDVLVHIFQAQSRAFYNLEGLWAHCPSIASDMVVTIPASAQTISAKP